MLAQSFVEPVPLLVPADNAKQRIKHIVGSMPQSRIFVDNGPYLRFELVSPVRVFGSGFHLGLYAFVHLEYA